MCVPVPAARPLHELRGLDTLEAGLEERGESELGSVAAAELGAALSTTRRLGCVRAAVEEGGGGGGGERGGRENERGWGRE